MTTKVTMLLAGALVLVPQSGRACVYPPPPLQLPGETHEAWRKRHLEKINQEAREQWKKEETDDFQAARRVFLGRIVKSEEIATDGSKFRRRVSIRPLKSLKGPLRTGLTTLRTSSLTSCGFEGGGRAVWGSVGSLAIVFEGLQPYGFGDLTTNSVLATDVQDERLSAAVRAFVEKHPEYDGDVTE